MTICDTCRAPALWLLLTPTTTTVACQRCVDGARDRLGCPTVLELATRLTLIQGGRS